jgi:hypothetical protein
VKPPSWLSRAVTLLRKGAATTPDPTELIRRELGKSPEEFDLSALVPVLVPRTFSETGNWPGPIYRLTAGDFDQTWAVLGADDAIIYVSRAMQAYWDGQAETWQQKADSNLRRIAEAEPYSHVCKRQDETVYMVVMLYGQNLGPSRLLVPDLLKDTFPEGYIVAIPEMTCAVAFTATPTSQEAMEIEDMIANMYARGSEPVSTGRYAPETLWQRSSIDLGLPG